MARRQSWAGMFGASSLAIEFPLCQNHIPSSWGVAKGSSPPAPKVSTSTNSHPVVKRSATSAADPAASVLRKSRRLKFVIAAPSGGELVGHAKDQVGALHGVHAPGRHHQVEAKLHVSGDACDDARSDLQEALRERCQVEDIQRLGKTKPDDGLCRAPNPDRVVGRPADLGDDGNLVVHLDAIATGGLAVSAQAVADAHRAVEGARPEARSE